MDWLRNDRLSRLRLRQAALLQGQQSLCACCVLNADLCPMDGVTRPFEFLNPLNSMNQDQPLDNDPVNHPSHYTSHPSGVECIQVTEHMSFNVGNAIKYLWRAGMKGAQLQDLEKARWYVDREIQRLAPKEVEQGVVKEPPLKTAGGRPIRSAVDFHPNGQGLLVTCRWCEHQQTLDCGRCQHVL